MKNDIRHDNDDDHKNRRAVEQKGWMEKYSLQFYAIGQNSISIPGNGEETFTLQTPGDVDFLLETLLFALNNTTGTSFHLAYRLADTTGRIYTDNFVNVNYFANSGSGHGERPINMNIPVRQNATLEVTIKNLSAIAVTNLSIAAIGRKNYSKKGFYKKDGRLWDQRFSLQHFTMGLNQLTLDAFGGVNDERNFDFKLPGDNEFLLEQLQVTADNQAGITYHVGAKLSDTTGRNYTNDFFNVNYFNAFGTGHAERPINMNIPFRKNTVLTVTLKNLDAGAALSNLSITLAGRKNYSDKSFFIYEYE